MRSHHRLHVALTLLGPIITRGGSSQPGIDAPAARDAHGRVMLPFSLVKGKVLDALRELYPNDPQVIDWFGKASAQGQWEPERGRVRFGDFHTTQTGRGVDPIIERIQIDHATGTAAGRMLMMTEAPFGYGEPVTFTGGVDVIADAAEAAVLRDTLDAALRWVPSYGALRTVGFGRTKRVAVTLTAPPTTMKGTPAGDSLPVRLTFDRPLCLVGKKHSRNHFDSLESVPGSVLKGATARLLLELCGSGPRVVSGAAPAGCAFPSVWKHLADIRFAEARPLSARATARPVVPPLSVVCANGTWYDVALEEGPRLINDDAPAFASDWKAKDETLIRDAFGAVDVPREVRIRTAIDAETGRAKDENLFSYGLVVPDRPGQEIAWETRIGLLNVPANERQAVRGELVTLYAHGLPNVGKTRAIAAVEWLAQPTPPAQTSKAPTDGVHVVSLQTDFLMTDPQTLQADGKTLHDAYADFWAEASGGALTLVRFFARQSLHGGYLARRFGGRGGYEPYLVTDRGSTFVLRATSLDAAARLAGWAAAGLPLPSWAATRDAQSGKPLWQTCPFVPEAGFGEVVVDLACHTEKRP